MVNTDRSLGRSAKFSLWEVNNETGQTICNHRKQVKWGKGFDFQAFSHFRDFLMLGITPESPEALLTLPCSLLSFLWCWRPLCTKGWLCVLHETCMALFFTPSLGGGTSVFRSWASLPPWLCFQLLPVQRLWKFSGRRDSTRYQLLMNLGMSTYITLHPYVSLPSPGPQGCLLNAYWKYWKVEIMERCPLTRSFSFINAVQKCSLEHTLCFHARIVLPFTWF